jgi:hypothetical protein
MLNAITPSFANLNALRFGKTPSDEIIAVSFGSNTDLTPVSSQDSSSKLNLFA